MKFNTSLREALFLQRKSMNIIEADNDGVKINLLCTNNNKLNSSAILGSRIWYTPERFIPSYCPAIWQLSEVDYGSLVCVNDNLCTDLFIEGFNNNIINFSDITNKNILLQPNQHLPCGHNYDFSLMTKETSKSNNITESLAFVILKSTTSEYFPEAEYSIELDYKDELYSLIHAKLLGYRAILCCFVFMPGVDQVCLSNKYQPEYASLLSKAIGLGVEIKIYGTNPKENSIEVTSEIKINSELK